MDIRKTVSRRTFLAGSVATVALATTAATCQPTGSQDVTDHGVVNDGVANTGATLSACFDQGGDWWVPAGSYRLASNMIATPATSLRVFCHDDAEFFGNPEGTGAGLNATMLEIRGSGPNIHCTWEGGTINQYRGGSQWYRPGQLNSLVIPYITTYPAMELGDPAVNVTDGLDFRAVSGLSTGFGSVTVRDTTFISAVVTPHWLWAGGDSQLFVEKANAVTIENTTHTGARDLGVYLSDVTNATMDNCTFTGCFGGAAVKRNADNVVFRNSTFTNCVFGATVNRVADNTVRRNITIHANTFTNNAVSVRLDDAQDTVVFNNTMSDVGHTGTETHPRPMQDENAFRPTGVRMSGCRRTTVRNNSVPSRDGSYNKALTIGVVVQDWQGIPSSDITVKDNSFTDLGSTGTANANSSNVNFTCNTANNVTNPTPQLNGTNSSNTPC